MYLFYLKVNEIKLSKQNRTFSYFIFKRIKYNILFIILNIQLLYYSIFYYSAKRETK